MLAMLPLRSRAEAGVLLFLILIGGIAEMVSVGAVIPFLTALVGNGSAASLRATGFLPASLTSSAVLFAAAVLAAGAIRLLLSWRTHRFALHTGHRIASEIHRRVLAQPYAFHLQFHSSGMLAALQKVQDLVWGVVIPVVQGLAAAVMAVFILLIFMVVTPAAAFIAALFFGGLYLAVTFSLRRRFQMDSRIVGSAYGERIRLIQESLGGIRDIIIDGSQAIHSETFRKTDKRFSAARARTAFLGSAPRYLIESLGLLIILALALLLARRDGGLVATLPLLGAIALGAQRLLPLIQQVYQSWAAIAVNRVAIGDLAELLSLPEPVEDSSGATLPFREELRLDHVSFAYPGRGKLALQDVSLTIQKGSRVALTGQTGSGKSTLADLIMGLIEPSAGRMLVDRVEITAANRHAWRRGISHVPQSIFLTDDSIARNIAFGSSSQPIDSSRLEEAIRTAQVDRFVDSLPDGIETRIGERGIQISGGQRQRLALARAIYRNKDFLVLDEATSALDPATEAAVIAALDELQSAGVTILIIAHRETSIAGCDQQFRREEGRIISA